MQFVLFLVVLVLVARMSRGDRRRRRELPVRAAVPPVPERLREIWWVRRMPQLVGGARACSSRSCCRSSFTESARHLTYTLILAFAICAVSVTVLTGWAGQLSLGQMAFAGIGALSAAALVRGVSSTSAGTTRGSSRRRCPPVPFVVGAAARRR